MSYIRPVQFRSVCPEQPFRHTFNHPTYGSYFLKEIRVRGWNYLFYDEDTFYYDPWVYEFYSSVIDYQMSRYSIRLNWRGTEIIITPETLSQLTGIPLLQNFADPFKKSHVDIELMLGGQAAVMATTLGVSTQSLCINQMVFHRWLCCNIMSTTNLVTIYPKHLKILHSFHTKERDLCVNRMLLRTIIESIRNQGSKLALPVLITRLILQVTTCQLPDTERTHITQISMTYALANCIQKNWPLHRSDTSRSPSPDMNVGDPSTSKSGAASPLPAGMDMRSLTQKKHDTEVTPSKAVDLRDPTYPWDDWELGLPTGVNLGTLLLSGNNIGTSLSLGNDFATSSARSIRGMSPCPRSNSNTSSPPNFEDREWINQLDSHDLRTLATKIWEGNAKLNRRIKRVEEKLQADGRPT